MRNSRYRVISLPPRPEDNSSERNLPKSEGRAECRSQVIGGGAGGARIRPANPSSLIAPARMSAPHFDPEEDPDDEEMVQKVGIITGGASGLPEPSISAVEYS